jgi:thiamine pyrophosphate-dependent acetolactate synthase large subunit-like protein
MAVCGDGGFMMNSQELETAVRLKLNLVVLIIRDDAYGMIRWKQAVDSFTDRGSRSATLTSSSMPRPTVRKEGASNRPKD